MNVVFKVRKADRDLANILLKCALGLISVEEVEAHPAFLSNTGRYTILYWEDYSFYLGIYNNKLYIEDLSKYYDVRLVPSVTNLSVSKDVLAHLLLLTN